MAETRTRAGNDAASTPKVVICGGGVIGAAIAYYLARRGTAATVVDRAGIAAAASGRAGGFLARDWCDGSPLGRLARKSFELHASLPEELGAELDYRRLDTFSVEAIGRGGLMHARHGHNKLPKWVDGHIVGAGKLGDESTTAQVHPRKLTEAFMARAQSLAGSRLVRGTITGIDAPRRDHRGAARAVTAVHLEAPPRPEAAAVGTRGAGTDGTPAEEWLGEGPHVLECDVVVVAMGPWSNVASAWLPLPMVVSSQKYHSAVLKMKEEDAITPAALFTSVREVAGGVRSEPEVYPRPHGEVYVCGEPGSPPLPAEPADVAPGPGAVDSIIKRVAVVASALGRAEVISRQACYLPLPADGTPVIGAVSGVDGAFVATGHSCWGILNAPATGLGMSELILDGVATTVDLSPFSPARFTPVR